MLLGHYGFGTGWYLVLGQYNLVPLGIKWNWVSTRLFCLYILIKVEIWSGVPLAGWTNEETTNKERYSYSANATDHGRLRWAKTLSVLWSFMFYFLQEFRKSKAQEKPTKIPATFSNSRLCFLIWICIMYPRILSNSAVMYFIIVRNIGYSSHFNTLVHTMIALHSGSDHTSY